MSNQPAEIARYIHGRATPGTSSRKQNVTNPATGSIIGQVALANAADVDARRESMAEGAEFAMPTSR
ncbi:acyl-CoA reductase-like NAD-dependent aldehyde dehydrogenase [Pseudomonas lini]|uniref:hypothetical protein n=1 Tax=Pseudomonas lini TaxID=163011 RepID=UPI00278B6B89|nr:hypothetical protein [Pseudomonas lini]MDQ0122900.1 acyl-CoA reductase-like NAD-dependent aldehyde dehydrogenase [Pseudomonas lini]